MTVETVFELVAVFVALAAAFGYINHRWFKLPHTIGILVIALATSVSILIAEALFPILGFGIFDLRVYDFKVGRCSNITSTNHSLTSDL